MILGRGISGEVRVGMDNNTQCAIKRFHDKNVDKVETWKREIKRLKQVHRHPNIITMLHAAEYEIYFELFPTNLGSLYGNFQPVVVGTLLRQLLDALRFIHSRGIVHNDVCWQNILVSNTHRLVLADWGAAHYAKDLDDQYYKNLHLFARLCSELCFPYLSHDKASCNVLTSADVQKDVNRLSFLPFTSDISKVLVKLLNGEFTNAVDIA